MSKEVQQSVIDSVMAHLSTQLRAHNENLIHVSPHRSKEQRPKRALGERPETLPSLRPTNEDGSVEVDGRLGKSILKGKAIEVFRTWNSSIYNLPRTIPVEEEVVVGGRRWIVKASTLGVDIGYGLFACEDIDTPAFLGSELQYVPALFPCAGPVYVARHWRVLVRQNPSWQVYQLDLDKWPGSHKRKEHTRTIDGDPVRYPNIAGYINSTQGAPFTVKPNVEWVTVAGSPHPPFNGKSVDDHVMTVGIRPIRAGEELFCDYPWGLG